MATIRELLGEAYKEGMTLEEIDNALSGKKLADLGSGEYVSRGKLNDYEKRMREAEKKLAERLTDDEKREAELLAREEHYKALERENNRIKMKERLSKSITDQKILDEVATLYADGKIDEALDLQNDYNAKTRVEMEKQIKAELLKSNPTPAPQNGGQKGLTKEDFKNMSYQERVSLYEKDPKKYEELKSN